MRQDEVQRDAPQVNNDKHDRHWHGRRFLVVPLLGVEYPKDGEDAEEHRRGGHYSDAADGGEEAVRGAAAWEEATSGGLEIQGPEELILDVVVADIGVTVGSWGPRGGAVGAGGGGDNVNGAEGAGGGWQEEAQENKQASAPAVFAGLWRHVCVRLRRTNCGMQCSIMHPPVVRWLAFK